MKPMDRLSDHRVSSMRLVDLNADGQRTEINLPHGLRVVFVFRKRKDGNHLACAYRVCRVSLGRYTNFRGPLVVADELAERLATALQKIMELDYSRAAINGCALKAYEIAKSALGGAE